MTYADLIQQRLQTLSPAQQAEVFDFVEFLASRRAAVKLPAAPTPQAEPATVGQSAAASWFSHPIQVPAFTPLSRDEANARD